MNQDLVDFHFLAQEKNENRDKHLNLKDLIDPGRLRTSYENICSVLDAGLQDYVDFKCVQERYSQQIVTNDWYEIIIDNVTETEFRIVEGAEW